MPEQIAGRSAVALARAVRDGAVHPRDVVEAHLIRIAELDPALHAFRVVRGEAALAEAEVLATRQDLADLPLAGVPIAIKDNIEVAGEPMTNGSAARDGAIARDDHPVVARLRAAGAVVVGVTTCPELCLWGSTDGHFGVTRNPWDPSRSPGGSSGGSAAAVAAGMVPVAQASDGLGSIRIPAAACGLFGIKPGSRVVPMLPGTTWFGLAEHGPLATTVADAAAVLGAMAGRPDLALVGPPGRRLRIGVSLRSPLLMHEVAPAWRETTLATARLLSRLGHDVVAARLTYPTRLAAAVAARWFAAASTDIAGLDHELMERRTRRHAGAGGLVRRLGLVRESDRQAWLRHAASAFRHLDVLVTPALAKDPLPADTWSSRSWTANATANLRFAPFTSPWNLAGYPAAAIPTGRQPSGAPLAVQLVAPPGGESLLLSLAAQLEQEAPWPRHAPLAATSSL